MASLFDLVQQYLKRDNLPKPFTYDRTNPPTIGPRLPVQPEDPNAPVKRILPVQGGGGDGFSVYNPDPNRTRDKSNYSPYAYRQAAERNLIGTPGGSLTGTNIPNTSTEVAKLMDMYPDYYQGKQLTGIPGAAANYLKNSFIGKGLDALGNMMPVNKRAIYENELSGQGIMLNDIGQIVSDGGNINTANNIMAGYNANKVTAQTFQKRRDMINAKMKDPAQKAAKLAALDAAEEKMLGTAKTRADMVFDDKSLAKDPTYKSQQELIELGIKSAKDDKEEDMLDPLNLKTTTAPAFMEFYNPYEKNYTTDPYVSGEDEKDTGTTPPGTSDDGYVTDYYGGDSVIDAGGTAPGGGYTTDYYGGDSVTDAGGTAPGGGYATDYYGGGNDTGSSYNTGSGYNATGKGGPAGQGTITNTSNYGTGTGNLGDYQIQPSNNSGNDGGNNNSGGTHCCTAANERGDMTLLEVKKLRVWHRRQSKIWQRGYDVWGRVMADNLVSKYKWSSDRVRDFYNHKIYGKRTIGSTFADFCIYPMSMIIGFILTVMPPILGYQKQENKNAKR